MENGNNNGYIAGDNFDEVMDTTGWAPDGVTYSSYAQPHLAQSTYPRYNANQPSYNQFDIPQQHQPSYPQIPFQNSPYSSLYQQDTSSGNYGGASYHNVESSLPNSLAYQGSNNNFAYAPQETATIAPQSLQYNNPPTRNVSNGPYQQSNHQGEIGTAPNQALYNHAPQTMHRPIAASSPQYQNVPHGNPDYGNKQSIQSFTGNTSSENTSSANTPSANTPSANTLSANASATTPPANTPQIQMQQVRAPLPGRDPLRVTNPGLYAAPQSSSRQSLEIAPYMIWNNEAPILVAPGVKSPYSLLIFPSMLINLHIAYHFSTDTIPKYHPRKSRSGKEPAPSVDLLSKSSLLKSSPL